MSFDVRAFGQKLAKDRVKDVFGDEAGFEELSGYDTDDLKEWLTGLSDDALDELPQAFWSDLKKGLLDYLPEFKKIWERARKEFP